MGIFAENTVELDLMIEKAYADSMQSKDIMQKFVYADYLTQLHVLRNNLLSTPEKVSWAKIFGANKRKREFYYFMNSLDRRCVYDYLQHKDFHENYFGELLDIENEILDNFLLEDMFELSTIPEEEFLEYLHEFLNKYKLDGIFDKIVQNKRLFISDSFVLDSSFTGGCYYEPFRRDTSIVLCDFEYNLYYLAVLIHELGHAFDMDNFECGDNGLNYLRYSYSAVNEEVVPIMFEKLFMDFIYEKKYLMDDVKKLNRTSLIAGKDRITDAYLLSLLDKKTILDEPKRKDIRKLIKQVSPYFQEEEGLKEELELADLDPLVTQKYAYGEVVGTVLKEQVSAEGFETPMFKEMMANRAKLFKPEFITKNVESSNYQKILTRLT